MMGALQLLSYILVSFGIISVTHAASFYGSSYIHVPLQDAKGTTDIFFRFKTSRPDAILFLAAGSIDYCLVELVNGAVRVRVNLGAGEAVLVSPSNLKLNDLAWHEVEIQRNEADLNLNIDNVHSSYFDIKGRFFELNIKFGIFIGGLGTFSELFLGNLRNLRGCITDVVFNDYDVLKLATESFEQRRVFGVTWDCSDEFEASSHQTISFVDEDAFLALPSWNARSGGTLSFELKTQSDMSVLFYNAGVQSKTDFVAIEIINGKISLSVNEGNGAVVVQSDVIVNDGFWHRGDVQFSPTYVEVTVDNQSKSLRPGIGENRYFDLAGYLYVGGIELNKHSKALQNGLQSIYSEGADSSFQGCIKNLKLNDQVIGLQEVELSFGIKPNCVWEYSCLLEPCIATAECFQDGIDSFRCICDQEICVQNNYTSKYKVYTKPSTPIDMELLSLHPLEVAEGGNGVITSQNIQVAISYMKYGIKESGVIFHVIEPPKFGRMEIETWRKISDEMFTLNDLNAGKILYQHDGSENNRDSIIFDLEFKAKNIQLPSFLEQNRRFVFHVHISQVNDPPRIILPPGKVLRVAKFTKMLLSPEILDVEDPDTNAVGLIYSLVTNGGAKIEGYIENSNEPGKAIDSFTQEDINNGLISYVHRGSENEILTMKVSDGLESTQTTILRISTFDLVITLVNNSGIILPYDSFALITVDNLTFATNAPDQALEVRYDIVKLPTYGAIQKFKGNEKWTTVTHFSQKQMRKERIRYVHTSGRPVNDEFKFTVSSMDIKVPTVYDFKINFIAIKLKRVNDKELILEKVLESHITGNELKYETEPIFTTSDQIIYTLQTVPSYGNIMLFRTTGTDRQHSKMDVGASFTQQDLDSKRLKYKLHRRSYSTIQDQFQFEVSSPGGISLYWSLQKIRHVPVDTDAVIINDKLNVLEGGEITITKNYLNIEIPRSLHIVYNITFHPKHGVIRILSPDLSAVQEESPSIFTTEHIENRRLIYVHDDSENDRDSAQFIGYPRERDGNDGFVYYGTLHINIIMKNDNPPVRAIDKVFYVVENSEKKLTGKDIKYIDADIDSKPSDIQYNRRVIPNGALFHTDTRETQVYQFTQDDLDQGRIIFKHSGPLGKEKVLLHITDGHFYATGTLEINATKPFIRVVENSGIIVKRSESQVLSSSSLSIETNLNANPEEIIYKIITHPKYGELLNDGKSISQFTQKELENENIEYENTNSPTLQDFFTFEVTLNNISTRSVFDIKVYPEIYWEPLKVISNKSLYVDEGHSVTIDPSSLHISHANIDPANITYIIRVPPRYGHLKIFHESKNNEEKTELTSVTSFSQATINDKKLKYVHITKNVTEDSFQFEVSNGVTSLTNLSFKINIISKIIILKTSNISLLEGKERILTEHDITVTNPYYQERITEFILVEESKHGFLSNVNNPGSKVMRFQISQLRNGFIRYTHDGSETTRDWFTLVASASGINKESAPGTVHVTIEPVNDETPYLVNNTGLEVWEGSITTITNTNLAAEDDDTQKDEICFVISTPSNGYVAHKNASKIPVLNFSQEEIDRGAVVFVHTGEKKGGFRLQVHDGVNYDSPNVFTITARLLQMDLIIKETLTVLPRMQQSITKDHLLVTTNDQEPSREILYHVIKEPILGRILLENPDGTLSPATRFTQTQINKNLVLYEQTEPMSGLKNIDSIMFNIETEYAEALKEVLFEIEISVGNIGSNNLDQLLKLHPVEVQEGASSIIGQEHIDITQLMNLWQGKGKNEFAKKLKIVVLQYPSFGWLDLEGKNFSGGGKLVMSREDIRKRRLRYHHDDSETSFDEMILGFFLSGEMDNTDLLLFNGSLNISISPINDNFYVLETQELSINAVRGQKVLINQDHLRTTDEDNSPEEIVYELVGKTSHGVLMMKDSNLSESIKNFTQDEINKELIYFVHDGTKEPGFFNFKVSDGKHKPLLKTFSIVPLPLTVQIVNKTVVELEQTSTAVFLGSKHLGIRTNGYKEETLYNITTQPRYGKVFINSDIVNHFSQKDLEKASIYYYMPLNLPVSEDYFELSIINQDVIIKNVILNVTVVPLIIQNSFPISPGGVLHLNLSVLNATELANKTSSNPKFTLFKLPKYGSLYKTEKRSKRKLNKIEITEFTHEEILAERILYKARNLHLKEDIVDVFEYFLTAPRVQPAKGKYEIILKAPVLHLSTSIPTFEHGKPNAGTVPVNDTDLGDAIRPRLSEDHLLIIVVAIGILLIATLLVILFRWCSIKSRKTEEVRSYRKNLKPLGLNHETINPELEEAIPSNGSASLSDYLPPPVPPTSPSSTGSRCESSAGHRSLNNNKSRSIEVDPVLPPPPYLHESDEWTEVNPNVPMCKVTPISHRDDGTLKGSTRFGHRVTSDLSDGENWSNFDTDSGNRYPDTLVLRKNQYWV